MLSFVSYKKLCCAILQILCLCTGALPLSAQNTEPLFSRQISGNKPYYSKEQVNIVSASFYTVKPAFNFTALSVEIDRSASFEGVYVVIGQDTFLLRADEHQAEEQRHQQSVLLIFDQPQASFTFYPATIHGEVSFSLINAESGREKANQRMQQLQKKAAPDQSTSCQLPEILHTSVWRTGLPQPSYSRTETNVRHVIVHHSAGSNTDTDYVNVVRNIYLFHTQVNGWSDIGYNYLIAQDGTIFQGRSFSNDQLDNDEVQGAHFCGKNSETMGICILGNYNTAVPTDTSVASLIKLTSWKLDKESLDPLASSSHPANSNLGVIAGHRNGCATECPGENLYVMLGDIRLEVEAYIASGCGEEEELQVFNVYPVPTAGRMNISLPSEQIPEAIWLTDATGKKFSVHAYQDKEEKSWVVETAGLAAGMYILEVNGEGFEEKRKLLIH